LFHYKCYTTTVSKNITLPCEWQTSYLFFHFTDTQSIPGFRKDPVKVLPAGTGSFAYSINQISLHLFLQVPLFFYSVVHYVY